MASTNRPLTVELQRKFARYSNEFQDILFELRNEVLRLRPHATERVDVNGLTYYDEEIGGPVKGGVCGISIERDHVRLWFIHGALLEDPSDLLEGSRDYKRFTRIYQMKGTNWENLVALIRAQIEYIESHH